MIPFMLLFLYSEADGVREIAQIQQEIRIINLVNGLELSAYQIDFILEKAKEAEEIRKDFLKTIEANEGAMLTTFNELKKNRMKDDVIPQTLQRQVHTTEGRFQDKKTEVSESLEQIAREVEGILEGNQIYALEHYIACLIPPLGESRIGQSEKPLGITKQLNRLREIPDYVYQMKKYEVADRVVEKIKKHLSPGTVFNEYTEKQRILGLLDEVRSLSDVDFVLNEEGYIEKFKGDYFPEKIPVNLSVKIERFLLNPLIIPILEEKLAST
ncbi:hypothetical protein AMJ52_05170 [candidate division TA06 bacterium DG_78]|uniref:Uncharacterized protein n=1 Tax=candidate division TA06 bacterium DG_78 TaxID=1703772 RepID=A0A0S7YDL1_UNCT6|nr:MAG: hypothetical protein AMJ52_05170 [candidate division TA06 bacterium DG_78]